MASVVVLRGDARHLPLPSDSVDLICTSPPFLNLRSYTDSGEHYDGQIGTGTRDSFLNDLWEVTTEMARVLKPEGSIFVELGDSYTDKCLNDTPHRYAIGCVDKLGLTKRAEIIWHHVNGVPEASVTDRAWRSHSVVFHFTRQSRYYAALDEIREGYSDRVQNRQRYTGRNTAGRIYAPQNRNDAGRAKGILGFGADGANPLGRPPGSVWGIASQPLIVPDRLGVEHYAAFPMKLPKRCILGWSPPGGVVLDPFGGTGTTALVASVLGRTGITVDRSADYCRLAAWRTTDPGERCRVIGAPKPPAVADGQTALFA